MPFDRYLEQATRDYTHDSPSDPQQQTASNSDDVHNHPSLSSSTVAFQLPSFIYSGPLALALGGGAEVLPTTLFAQHSGLGGDNGWLANPAFSS